jgi:DNA-binding PadR family transcriptional regulator
LERAVESGFSDLGRYAEPSLRILVSLSDGPKHGYAIMDDSEATGGRRIGAGTLYAALARLERLGMIEALPADGSRRRPYRLTALGAASLKAQLEDLRRLADTGLGRLDGVHP